MEQILQSQQIQKSKYQQEQKQNKLHENNHNFYKQNSYNNLIVNRAFFGKGNCLKVTLNKDKECYFHWGIEKKLPNEQTKYEWIKVKFNDLELADIINVLQEKKQSVAFFHKYNNNTRQIWINKIKENANNDKPQKSFTFIKVKELSKSLTEPESEVLRIILINCIWKMNEIN